MLKFEVQHARFEGVLQVEARLMCSGISSVGEAWVGVKSDDRKPDARAMVDSKERMVVVEASDDGRPGKRKQSLEEGEEKMVINNQNEEKGTG